MRFPWLLAVVLLAAVLSMGAATRASLVPPSPATAPVIESCTFVPDPRLNTPYDCLDPSAPAANANVSISFQVNVSDATDNNMSVTFYFDYYNALGVNPDSPFRRINVSPPSGGLPVSVNTTWTYTQPNANFSGLYIVHINVTNDANESSSPVEFVVDVTYNLPPSMGGLLSVNPVSQSIKPVDPVVPLVYENVTVYDPDGDPVTITWDWGDGTRTVNTTEPLTSPLDLIVTHQYAASFLPLNETPRDVDILVRVWIDDGLGHNESGNSTTEFRLDFDFRPNVHIDRPALGSVWKVGEPVTMVGNASDPEGSPTTSYWDFDNRTDSTNTGDPTRNQDATGTTAMHAYALPGVYNISFWSTDGDKKLCLVSNCTIFTSHWTSAVAPIEVRSNNPPHVALDNATGEVGVPMRLRAYVFDEDADNMTIHWDFGDGTPVATSVTVGAGTPGFELFQEHNYTEPGNHTLTVSVDDGTSTVNGSRTVFVQSFNLPPALLGIDVARANGTPALNNTFLLNETVVIHVLVHDAENDTLNVSVDWDDGSVDNRTIDPKTASECSMDNLSHNVCTVSFSHKYTDIGSDQIHNYTILVSVTDNEVYLQQNRTGGPPISLKHTKVQSAIVFITNLRVEGLGPWDWWDYSTLAAVLGVPSLLIARFAWKVRRERQEA